MDTITANNHCILEITCPLCVTERSGSCNRLPTYCLKITKVSISRSECSDQPMASWSRGLPPGPPGTSRGCRAWTKFAPKARFLLLIHPGWSRGCRDLKIWSRGCRSRGCRDFFWDPSRTGVPRFENLVPGVPNPPGCHARGWGSQKLFILTKSGPV